MIIVLMVLLGTRAALKDDLGCSTAELVYGALLCLPGELFSVSDVTLPDTTKYTNQLRMAMQGRHVCPHHARFLVPRNYVCTPTYLYGVTVSGTPCSNIMMNLTRFYNAPKSPSYSILTVVVIQSS